MFSAKTLNKSLKPYVQNQIFDDEDDGFVMVFIKFLVLLLQIVQRSNIFLSSFKFHLSSFGLNFIF